MIVRCAGTVDADIVGTLVSALLIELYPEMAADYARDPLIAVAARLLGSERVFGFVAEDEAGTAVGVLMLNECEAIYAHGSFGEISELYVAGAHRASGIGRQLIAAAVDFARDKGWPMLEVGAPDTPRWQATVDFYKRNGFSEVGPRLYRLI